MIRLLNHVLAAAVSLPVPLLAAAQAPVKIESRFAEVNGLKMHYLVAGKGDRRKPARDGLAVVQALVLVPLAWWWHRAARRGLA